MILTKETLSAGPSIGTGEGVAHSKRWYVALVRMHHEKKVAERLDKMGIENFVPVQQDKAFGHVLIKKSDGIGLAAHAEIFAYVERLL